MRYLKYELLLVVAILGAGGIIALSEVLAKSDSEQPYELIGEDLEPFRTAFNEASDHVRAVLLVAPT